MVIQPSLSRLHFTIFCFVDFEDVNIFRGYTKRFTNRRNSKRRANAHFVGFYSNNFVATEDTDHRQAKLSRLGSFHEKHGRGTVTDLRGITRGGSTSLFERIGSVNANGEVVGGAALFALDEIE